MPSLHYFRPFDPPSFAAPVAGAAGADAAGALEEEAEEEEEDVDLAPDFSALTEE
jgi:hypothetical protein